MDFADGFCHKTRNKDDFLRQIERFLADTGSPAKPSGLE
jgi:hypothetical protein